MDRVHVANLPPDIRIKDIDDFFRPFGKLVYIDVNHRSNPVYAYVQFDTARNAFNAVKSRHGYDYEGYTLQLRLVENEVRKRRDATPPPPPPSMFISFDRQNGSGFNNNLGNSNSRMGGNFSNSMFQPRDNSHWGNSRSGMTQQQNMLQYPNMDLINNNRQQNMLQSGSSRLNMLQQYSNSNRSNMQQQHSNSNSNMNYPNRSDMSQQNNYSNRSDMSSNSRANMQQQYNTNRSNMSQQQEMNMMGYSNNSGNRMNWNYGNDGKNYNNVGRSEVYNANNDPYARPGFEDSYTRGLSGSGRKWFNRYIRQGFSAETARAKALEHRTVPYLREDPKNKNMANDPTNAALETIGNTIISLLATNPNENLQQGFGNNMGSGNIDMRAPRSSLSSQTPRNAVSKQQYLRSIDILKRLKSKPEYANDLVAKKHHTQIIRDFEQFRREVNKSGGAPISRSVRNDIPIISTASAEKLEEKLRRKKGQLLKSASRLKTDQEGKKRLGGAFKKRVRILFHDAGFSELEAKSLALHPLEDLRALLALKKEYDLITKKTDFIPSTRNHIKETPKLVVYRNDMKYLNMYKEHRLSKLSRRIITALNECISRIHKYEIEQRLPLTKTRFVTMLQKINLKQIEEKKALSNKTKNVVENKKSTPVTTTEKKTQEKKHDETTEVVDAEMENLENVDNQENENITEDNQDNEDITDDQDNENIAEDDQEDQDITEEYNDVNEEEFEDADNLENGIDQDQSEDDEDKNNED